MKIIIMRHGLAEALASSDENRCLTDYGIKQAEKTGQWLKREQYIPTIIFSSHYLRAQQTARLVAKQLSHHAIAELKIQNLNFVTPESNPKEVHDYLDALVNVEGHQALLLVSHMPLVSYLLTELTYENVMLSFNTAMAVVVDYDVEKAQGHIEAQYSPELTRTGVI